MVLETTNPDTTRIKPLAVTEAKDICTDPNAPTFSKIVILFFKVEQQKITVSSLETAKSELEQELQELKERQDEMLTENSAMAEHLETLKSLHAEEKVKLVSTSAQQSKLIDFMQSKAESKTSKWKVRYGELVMMLVNW